MNNEIANIYKELLQEALVENGVSEEAHAEAMNAIGELEGINESARSLAKARESGETRLKWLENQLAEMTSEMGDETADRFREDVTA